MKTKKIAISVLAILLLSGILMTTVSAAVWTPSLPSDLVTMEITNPYTTPLCPDSYPFMIDLSNVDLGFDITDGSYIGWCVDITHGITREVPYEVMLYSSYDEMAPIPSEDWNRINYILNNKQGTGCDVQAAIWYFINGGAYWWITGDPFDPSADPDVQNMVDNALTNGDTYEPGVGDILAIVCVPEDECAQTVIIELEIPGEFEGLTPGYWKNRALMPNAPYSWTSPYTPTTLLSDVFTNDAIGVNFNGKTLLSALNFGGGPGVAGAEMILLRAAVAALLNAAHPDINYPMTTADVIDQVNAALQGNNRAATLDLASQLDTYNNLGVS